MTTVAETLDGWFDTDGVELAAALGIDPDMDVADLHRALALLAWVDAPTVYSSQTVTVNMRTLRSIGTTPTPTGDE